MPTRVSSAPPQLEQVGQRCLPLLDNSTGHVGATDRPEIAPRTSPVGGGCHESAGGNGPVDDLQHLYAGTSSALVERNRMRLESSDARAEKQTAFPHRLAEGSFRSQSVQHRLKHPSPVD